MITLLEDAWQQNMADTACQSAFLTSHHNLNAGCVACLMTPRHVPMQVASNVHDNRQQRERRRGRGTEGSGCDSLPWVVSRDRGDDSLCLHDPTEVEISNLDSPVLVHQQIG